MREAIIGIIGGTGGMGRWFAELLKKEGYVVHLAGRKLGMNKEEMAGTCNVVVVSVPIGVTREVIESIGPLLPENALLMDLTSLKVDPRQCHADVFKMRGGWLSSALRSGDNGSFRTECGALSRPGNRLVLLAKGHIG